MIETIHFNGKHYPAHEASGNAARFAIPFAKEILKHCQTVYDVGCNRVEWMFPGAIPIDPAIDSRYSATKFPDGAQPQGIFSSHCLEHIPDWVGVLDYWHSRLPKCGVVFLYLPHPDQEYWLPWNNRKHIHALYPSLLELYFKQCRTSTGMNKWHKVMVTGSDLNHSYYVIAEKI